MRSARHLLRFAALGAGLFLLDRAGAGVGPASVPAARAVERAAAFSREAGALPDARERELLERDALDEELLAREARRLGLDRDDAVVCERLVRNMAFLLGPELAPDRLYREALGLGMDASDPLVRRRLAARMSARLRADAATQRVQETDLRDWFDRHRASFAAPPRVRLSQVYFSRAAGERAAESRARAVLGELRRASPSPDAAALRGDPWLLGNQLPSSSEAELARDFGPDFARAAFDTASGVWAGPIASSQGVHLIFVHGREPARPAELDAVRAAVRDALVAEREDAALREGLRRLREQAAAGGPR